MGGQYPQVERSSPKGPGVEGSPAYRAFHALWQAPVVDRPSKCVEGATIERMKPEKDRG